jgi:hypothetical protein
MVVLPRNRCPTLCPPTHRGQRGQAHRGQREAARLGNNVRRYVRECLAEANLVRDNRGIAPGNSGGCVSLVTCEDAKAIKKEVTVVRGAGPYVDIPIAVVSSADNEAIGIDRKRRRALERLGRQAWGVDPHVGRVVEIIGGIHRQARNVVDLY